VAGTEDSPREPTVFLHRLDAQGMLMGRADGLAALTDTPSPADVLVQRHVVPLGDDLTAGLCPMSASPYVRGGDRMSREQRGGDALVLEAVELLDAGD
jgi:hypothetical protein